MRVKSSFVLSECTYTSRNTGGSIAPEGLLAAVCSESLIMGNYLGLQLSYSMTGTGHYAGVNIPQCSAVVMEATWRTATMEALLH